MFAADIPVAVAMSLFFIRRKNFMPNQFPIAFIEALHAGAQEHVRFRGSNSSSGSNLVS